MKKLFRFHGGIHPVQHKEQSTRRPIVLAPLPKRLVVPLQQHAGPAATAIVKPGDKVLKGQTIGQAQVHASVAVHAPSSGEVLAVDMQTLPHPSGLAGLCVTMAPDGAERAVEYAPSDYRNLGPTRLREELRKAGVTGLGGAAFPSHIKLDSGRHKVHTLVINGAECEPYITCDDLLMRERAGQIVRGIEILQFMLGADRVLVALEDNKPEALAAMQGAVSNSGLHIDIVKIPTIYPSGGAKQLIKILTGIEVPDGKRVFEYGVQCFNTGTAYSIHRALNLGEPVMSRVVTIAGNVEQAQNFEALIGTPVAELTSLAQDRADSDGYIMGGPLMGFPLPSRHVPIVKATICILATSSKLFPPRSPEMPCIRCGQCADACPADLQPHELYWFAKSRNFDKARAYALFDCIECGACSYVCPSHIPLVQYYRFAKSEITAQDRERAAADSARERHNLRQLRLQREQAEPPAVDANEATNAKQALIKAAIEKARTKRI